MTGAVVSATGDTPVAEIARLLLQNHISAIPILDEGGAPIGMVSEGDLLGRDETDSDGRRDWWLVLLAEGESLSADFLASLRRPQRVAKDVMSKPVVTVDENADAGEIARLLAAQRIKRVPVVRNGQVVGIVSRQNLLRVVADQDQGHEVKPKEGLMARTLGDALAPLAWHFERPRHEPAQQAAPANPPDKASPTAADFQGLVQAFENQETHSREEMRHKAQEERQHQAEELIGTHMSDDAWRNLFREARAAAGRGLKEFLLLRFPSALCTDGGRAINAPDPDWPATLRGEAAEIYLRWSRDLKPQGFHLAARVVEFPDGMPGDIGMFLVWG